MRILGIETSCDETSAAVVEDGVRVLSNVIASSKDAFAESGGVIPEEAARKQVESILPVIGQALKKADCAWGEIDAFAVTKGPGLLVSLLVGSTVARTLSSIHGIPLIGVHHTLGHLSSSFLEENPPPVFPLIALTASGGHTDLWLRRAHTEGVLLGRTRDDAAGEAFDKGAQMLGLSYPGGPAIAKTAEGGDPDTFEFPLPLREDDSLDFSFSGLKTSLKYTIRDHPDAKIPDLAASYQLAICRHLADRIKKAVALHPEAKEVHLVGGVSANIALRSLVTQSCAPLTVRTPKRIAYCTDNAAMIAAAAFYLAQEKGNDACKTFETTASLPLSAGVA